MSTAILSLPYRIFWRNISSVRGLRFPWKALYLLVMVAAVCMVFFYIFTINQLTQGAYIIKNYNREIGSLLAENKNLQASFDQTSFLGGVQQKAQALSFQKTANIKYLQILQHSLAEAR